MCLIINGMEKWEEEKSFYLKVKENCRRQADDTRLHYCNSLMVSFYWKNNQDFFNQTSQADDFWWLMDLNQYGLVWCDKHIQKLIIGDQSWLLDDFSLLVWNPDVTMRHNWLDGCDKVPCSGLAQIFLKFSQKYCTWTQKSIDTGISIILGNY